MAMMVLIGFSPSTVSADEWSANRIHGASSAANQTAHTAAAGHAAGRINAALAAMPHDNRRPRVEHLGLSNQATELSHQAFSGR